MIIVKVINQRVAQVVIGQPNLAGQLASSILATRNKKQLTLLARTLVQTTAQSQKVTSANNQQLIPIARNISFRQCQASHFISADLEPYIVVDNEQQQGRESPFETLKRRARDAVEKRESTAKSQYYNQSFDEALAGTTERKLVVLMSWLEAKEKHIEKYRQFYLDRGFDVLNVKTSPWDLLLPNYGARKISEDFVRFMIDKQYSNVVLHGFSVGGYMFGRLLLEMDKYDQKVRDRLLKSVRGLVFDSLVPMEGISVGVANSITRNPLAAKLCEQLLELYLNLGYNIATKYYSEASEKVWGGPLKCPSLFLNSREDRISDHKIVERLASVWSNLGIETHKMVVDKSPHVQIFQKHHEAYVDRVEKFLERINMK